MTGFKAVADRIRAAVTWDSEISVTDASAELAHRIDDVDLAALVRAALGANSSIPSWMPAKVRLESLTISQSDASGGSDGSDESIAFRLEASLDPSSSWRSPFVGLNVRDVKIEVSRADGRLAGAVSGKASIGDVDADLAFRLEMPSGVFALELPSAITGADLVALIGTAFRAGSSLPSWMPSFDGLSVRDVKIEVSGAAGALGGSVRGVATLGDLDLAFRLEMPSGVFALEVAGAVTGVELVALVGRAFPASPSLPSWTPPFDGLSVRDLKMEVSGADGRPEGVVSGVARLGDVDLDLAFGLKMPSALFALELPGAVHDLDLAALMGAAFRAGSSAPSWTPPLDGLTVHDVEIKASRADGVVGGVVSGVARLGGAALDLDFSLEMPSGVFALELSHAVGDVDLAALISTAFGASSWMPSWMPVKVTIESLAIWKADEPDEPETSAGPDKSDKSDEPETSAGPDRSDKSDKSATSVEFSLEASLGPSSSWTPPFAGLSVSDVKIEVSREDGVLGGAISGGARLEDADLDLTFRLEMPSEVFALELSGAVDAAAGAKLLDALDLIHESAAASDAGKHPTLTDLSIGGSLALGVYVVHVEAKDLVHLPALEVDSVVADMRLGSETEVALVIEGSLALADGRRIEIDLAGEATSTGWRLEGAATFPTDDPAGATTDDASGVKARELVSALSKQVKVDGFSLPELIADMEIVELDVTVDTWQELVAFHCAVAWPHDGATLNVTIEHRRQHGLSATGLLQIEGCDFEVEFNAGSALIVGAFTAESGPSISLARVMKALGAPIEGAEEFSFELKDAAVAYGGAKSEWLVAADLGLGFDLAALHGLPLVGAMLPADQSMTLAFAASARGTWSRKREAELKAAWPKTVAFPGKEEPSETDSEDSEPEVSDESEPATPGEAKTEPAEPGQAKSTVTVDATLEIGDHRIPLQRPDLPGKPSLALVRKPPKAPLKVQPPHPSLQRTGEATPVDATDPSTSEADDDGQVVPGAQIAWTAVNLSFGPLHISRVGWLWDSAGDPAEEVVSLAFDGALSFGGLTLSVQGFGARYHVDHDQVEPMLSGLGLDFSAGPVELSGTFVRVDGDFAGKVLIRTEELSIAALGAFTMIQGAPSMFVYGVLDYPIGGPVFFFVEGLAAGFGYNRQLIPPRADSVRTFPLVIDAVASAGGGKPAAPVDPVTQLEALHEYVRPALGQNFLAVGVKFNSFKLFDSFLLMVLSFGTSTEIDLIGTSAFRSPPAVPGAPSNVPALAQVGLQLVGRVQPEAGTLQIEAMLTPGSYVYGPACSISGGFAFYSWFKGPDEGKFVLSVGGYHPSINPEAMHPRWPVVQPISIKYELSPAVTITGTGYFALTPSMLMAGCHVNAAVDLGRLEASFSMSVDFLVSWAPYHYSMEIDVGIHARWRKFHTSASAHLSIEGPEFSGHAHVHWWVFSFDVDFGARKNHGPTPIAWHEFEQQFLPAANKVCSVRAATGLVAVVPGALPPPAGATPPLVKPPETWVVNPALFSMEVSTAVPATCAGLGAPGTEGPRIGLAPMNGRNATSRLTVTVRHFDGKEWTTASEHFKAVPIWKNFPAALWGTDFRPSIDRERTSPGVINAIGALTITPTPAVIGDSTGSKTFDEGAFTDVNLIALPQRATPGSAPVLPELTQSRFEARLRGLGFASEDASEAKMFVVEDIKPRRFRTAGQGAR